MTTTLQAAQPNTKRIVESVVSPAMKSIALAVPAVPLRQALDVPEKTTGFFRKLLRILRNRQPDAEFSEAGKVQEPPTGNPYDRSYSGHLMIRL
jgi:hypothetical protein